MTVKTVDCGVGSSPPPVRRGSIKSQYGQKSESGFIRNASADSGIGRVGKYKRIYFDIQYVMFLQ